MPTINLGFFFFPYGEKDICSRVKREVKKYDPDIHLCVYVFSFWDSPKRFLTPLFSLHKNYPNLEIFYTSYIIGLDGLNDPIGAVRDNKLVFPDYDKLKDNIRYVYQKFKPKPDSKKIRSSSL